MAMNVQLGPQYDVSDTHPDLSEEQASQGHKTGHIRWVLAIGFALAVIGVGATALIQA